MNRTASKLCSLGVLFLLGATVVFTFYLHRTDHHLFDLKASYQNTYDRMNNLNQVSNDIRFQRSRYADHMATLSFLEQNYQTKKYMEEQGLLEKQLFASYKAGLMALGCTVEEYSDNMDFCQEFRQNIKPVQEISIIESNDRRYSEKLAYMISDLSTVRAELVQQIDRLQKRKFTNYYLFLLLQLAGIVLVVVAMRMD